MNTATQNPNENGSAPDLNEWHVTGVQALAGQTYTGTAAVMAAIGAVSPFPARGTYNIKPGAWPAATFTVRELVGEVVAELDALAPKIGSFTYTSGEQEFNADSAARIKADDAHLRSFGIVLPPPVVQLGGVVNETGRENLARSHAEWAATPLTVDAMGSIVHMVNREARQDELVGARGRLRMNDAGQLYDPESGRPAFDIEEHAWKQMVGLSSDIFPRMAEGLALMDAPLRAKVWNEQVGKSARADRPVVLRTRATRGGRAVFAGVSEKYEAFDADRVAETVRDALRQLPGGEDARGEVMYRPEDATLQIDALWHADKVANFAAGDVFKYGARIQTNDAGGGSIRVSALVMRNLCYNLIVVATKETEVERIRHMGDESLWADRIAEAVRRVSEIGAPFIERWGYARTIRLADLLPPEKVSESAQENVHTAAVLLAENRSLNWGGSRDAVVDAIDSAWKFEEGSSYADLLNAITRIHAAQVPVPVLRAAEQNAGRLLYHTRPLDAVVA